MRFLVVLVLSAMALRAADRCDPPPELAGFIQSLPNEARARRTTIEERLKETADDFTLNRLLLDSSVYERKPVRDRYRQLLEAHPDSIDYQYLQARSLVGSDTKEALRLYARILGNDPDYPWVHLSQLEIYRSEAFRDRSSLASSFSTFARVCPASFSPYRYLNEISDDQAVSQGAASLRKMLGNAADRGNLTLYRTLWAIEFRLRPKAEQDDERRQIAEDLKQLMTFAQDPAVRPVIENGAKLSGDEALAKRMAAEKRPNAQQVVMNASNDWVREHPRPKEGDPPEKRAAWGSELLTRSLDWIALEPDDPIGYMDRVRALISMGAPAEDIARAGDALLALIHRSDPMAATWIQTLAAAYAEGGVLLDRVPALISEGIDRFDDPETVVEIDLAPNPGITANNRTMMVEDRIEALATLAKSYEKQEEMGKAREALRDAEDFMAAHPPPPDDAGVNIRSYRVSMQVVFWRAKAELADKEGRKLDALTWYRRSRSFRPSPNPESLEHERTLWKELGGSDEGWQHWIETAADSPPKIASPAAGDFGRSAANRKLPPLSVEDIEGNRWTLDRFTQKTVIAVVWATWCEPCRAELPYFAKLVDRVRDRRDVLAISFNTDDNIALAEAFARSAGYTFPVLSAKQYAEDLMPLMAIPRTWIIRNGMIAEEHVGFSRDGDKWVDEMLSKLK